MTEPFSGWLVYWRAGRWYWRTFGPDGKGEAPTRLKAEEIARTRVKDRHTSVRHDALSFPLSRATARAGRTGGA